jgi:hypothetical protein
MKIKLILVSIFIIGVVIFGLGFNPQVTVDAVNENFDVIAENVPGDVLRDLPPQSWYAVPDTHMRGVCPPNGFGGKDYDFNFHCSSVIGAWSGGAYDTLRNRMIIWGGGHNDYYGNELYAFDVNTLAWDRLSDPDLDFELYQDCRETHASGNPTGRHTYGGLAYIAHVDQLFAHGGSLACGPGETSLKTWTYELSSSTWDERALGPMGEWSRADEYSVYDPVSQNVYLFWHSELFLYNYDQDRWRQLDNDQISWLASGVAIDTKRNLLISVGNGYVSVYDLNDQNYERQHWSTTGAEELVNAYAPGLAYDPLRDRIVGWAGGDIFSLNVETKQWARSSVPGGPEKRVGDTFGRFRYIPEYDVFIAVTHVDEDVFFYKPAAGELDPIPGDLNLDRIVNSVDVNLGVQVILGLERDSGIVGRMDVNLDGRRDVLDLQAIVNLVEGT